MLTIIILFVILRTCRNQSKCTYIKYKRHLLNILLNLCNLHPIFNIFEKKKTLLAYVFSKLRTVKDTVTQMFKYLRVIASFYSQHVKRCQKLVKCQWENFDEVSWSSWLKLAWKTSLLFICEHVQVFIKTLTADHKHSLCYIFNIQVRYQTQLSKKLEIVSQFFSTFSKSSSYVEHSGRKDDIHSQCIYEIIDCKGYG